MNDLLTTPPERDLPRAAAHRRLLVATVAANRRPPSRLMPAVAAGAAVLAAGGGVVAVTMLASPGAVLSPGTQPADPYVEVCPHPGGPGGPPSTPPPTPMAGVPAPRTAVVFTDRYGQLALVGSRTDFMICGVQPDGRHLRTDTATRINSGIAVAEIADHHAVLGGVDFGSAFTIAAEHGPARKALGYLAVGWVGPDVTRVTVTWTGQQPVRAAVGDGFFASRLVLPYPGHKPKQLGFVLRAYDANGRQVAVVDNSTVPTAQPGAVLVDPTSGTWAGQPPTS
jgi:hypothetical protein